MKEIKTALKIISRGDYGISDEDYIALGYSLEDLDYFKKHGYYPTETELKVMAEELILKYFTMFMGQ